MKVVSLNSLDHSRLKKAAILEGLTIREMLSRMFYQLEPSLVEGRPKPTRKKAVQVSDSVHADMRVKSIKMDTPINWYVNGLLNTYYSEGIDELLR